MATIDTTHGGQTFRILLVDDSADTRNALSKLLEIHGLIVTTASDGESALRAMHEDPEINVVITDYFLPDIDGREVARQARLALPTARVILITGWETGRDLANLESWGIDAVVLKPFDIKDLLKLLRPRPSAPAE